MTSDLQTSREDIPAPYCFLGVSLSVVFFLLLNTLVRHIGYPAAVLHNGSSWKWRNLFVSWFHAVIVSLWTASCYYWYPELTQDLVFFNNMYIYALTAFSAGYFVYDFIDIAVSGQTFVYWEVVLHHFAVAGMFFLNMLGRQCIAFTAVVLIVEINTVFLHTRKMLQMCKVPFSSWIYRTNAVANIATFVSCRFGCISYVIHCIVAFNDVLGSRYVVIVSLATIVMSVINIVLFWRLICSDFVRGHRSRASSNKKSAHIKESQDEVSSSSVDACADYASNGFALRKRDTSGSSHCQPFAAAYDGLEIECTLIAQNILSSFGGDSCADDGLASKMQLDINGIAG